ncbi:MAG: hypothetical protein RL385_1747 [Pseudomonadota bacterium]|jgi:hypothetical protein
MWLRRLTKAHRGPFLLRISMSKTLSGPQVEVCMIAKNGRAKHRELLNHHGR